MKWGEITNNEIVAAGDDMDAVSAWHFSGIVANNQITSTQEGMHLSFGKIAPGMVPPFLENMPQYWECTFEHNAFGCNNQNGLHFTHGSSGTIRNNLFLKSWSRTGHPEDFGAGLHIGVGSYDDCDEFDPTECYDEATFLALGPTVATVHNNTMDQNRGPGCAVHPITSEVTFYANVVSRSGPGWSGLQAHPNTWVHHFEGWNNVLWANDSDYSHLSLVGTADRNGSTGNNHPHYQGPLGGNEYSYMLKHHIDEPCDYDKVDLEYSSNAVDAGDIEDPDDVQPPGVHLERSDAGAYGGPEAAWFETQPCDEYKTMIEGAVCGG